MLIPDLVTCDYVFYSVYNGHKSTFSFSVDNIFVANNSALTKISFGLISVIELDTLNIMDRDSKTGGLIGFIDHLDLNLSINDYNNELAWFSAYSDYYLQCFNNILEIFL